MPATGSIPIIQRSTNAWKGCIFFGVIGITTFFVGFAIPHQIYGEFSDTTNQVCGEIGAGLWQYCTRACSDTAWQCRDWSEEEDFLTVSRVLQLCAAFFAVLGFVITAISRVCRRRSNAMLMATVVYLLAAVTCAAGIGNFIAKEGSSIDDHFGWMPHSKWHLDWAGGVSVAAAVIFSLNVGFCLVDRRLNKLLMAYEEV